MIPASSICAYPVFYDAGDDLWIVFGDLADRLQVVVIAVVAVSGGIRLILSSQLGQDFRLHCCQLSGERAEDAKHEVKREAGKQRISADIPGQCNIVRLPGALNAASIGTGGITHLASEYFNIQAGVKTQHVPYKGTGLVLTDLVAGQVQLFFAPPAAIIPFIKSGKLKGMAVTTESRMTALPQVPTFAEAGLPSYELKSWYGVLAPGATPKRLLDRLSAEIARALAQPDVRKSMLA